MDSIRSSWSRGSIRRLHPHLHFQMPLQRSRYNRRTQWQTIDRLSMFIFGNSPYCRILLGLVNICELSRIHIQPRGFVHVSTIYIYIMIAHLSPIRIVIFWKAKSFWTRFDLHTPKFDTFCFLMSNAFKWSMVSMVTSIFLKLVGIPLRSYTCDGTPKQKFRQSFIPAQNKKHHQKKTQGSTAGNIAGWKMDPGLKMYIYIYIYYI